MHISVKYALRRGYAWSKWTEPKWVQQTYSCTHSTICTHTHTHVSVWHQYELCGLWHINKNEWLSVKRVWGQFNWMYTHIFIIEKLNDTVYKNCTNSHSTPPTRINTGISMHTLITTYVGMYACSLVRIKNMYMYICQSVKYCAVKVYYCGFVHWKLWHFNCENNENCKQKHKQKKKINRLNRTLALLTGNQFELMLLCSLKLPSNVSAIFWNEKNSMKNSYLCSLYISCI